MTENVHEIHEEKLTLTVDVNLPGHEDRVTTPIFTHSRSLMSAQTGDRCQVTGETPAEAGPVEWHHVIVERCLAEAVDPQRLHEWIELMGGIYARADAWFTAELAKGRTYEDIWAKPYDFVDDMTVNGLGLCKRVHTGRGEGIHYLPYPLWSMWAIGRAGFEFVGHDKVVDETSIRPALVPAPPLAPQSLTNPDCCSN